MSTSYDLVALRIPIELIDPPELAARVEFDADKMAELIASIAAEGLIEPLIVKKTGERYQVVAGHRRWYACPRAGEFRPPCVVRDVDARTTESLKVKENKDREDVNPVHEGMYFEELLAKHCNGDVRELAEFVKESYDYVSGRLNLVRGCELVRAAAAEGKIGLGVALELNRIKLESDRRMYLRTALAGATTAQVKQWRVELERHIADQGRELPGGADAGAGVVAPGATSGPQCIVCLEQTEMHKLRMYYVHVSCYEAILLKMLRQFHGSAAPVQP